MALAYAFGAIQWLAADAVSTTYPVTCTDVVTGVSFQPVALRFTWCGAQSGTNTVTTTVDQNRGVGFAVSTSSRRCVDSFSDDGNAAGANCGTMARDDSIACTTDGTGAADGMLDLNSIDSGGFTAIVDNQPTNNITVFWEAWGGTDITAATVIDISEPAATGNVDYTATGFIPGSEDQVVMFAGVQDSNALNTGLAEASGFTVGYATGPTVEQFVYCGNSDDASATTDVDGVWLAGECINMIARAGAGTVECRASLTQFNNGGFRLNWAARGVTARKYIALAIKGGSWQAGDLRINPRTVNNTAKVSGLRFKPIGINFVTAMRSERSSNSTATVDVMSWGCCSSTSSRQSLAARDVTGVTTTVIGLALNYDQVALELSTAAALITSIDVSAMDADGFTLIVDDADAGTPLNAWVGWLAFGHFGNYDGADQFRAHDQPMIRGPM